MRKILYEHNDIKMDSGVFFGKGIFETILIKDKPIFLKEHIIRLNNSIINLGLGKVIDLNEVNEFIKEKNISNKALKIIVTEKNLIYTTRDIKYTKNHYIEGFTIMFSEVLRNSTSRIVNFKTLNYLENIIEYELCQSNGFNEAIFLNEKEYVCEGCTTNIFIIKNKKIYTPSVQCGLLPGIVRQWVIKNFEVIEKEITKDELLNSDEVFLTNSLVGVIKVSKIENKIFNNEEIDEIKKQYDEAINGGE